MSYEDVIKNFATRKINSKSKNVTWSCGRVYCENDIAFSWGRHFPLAKYLGEEKGKPLFILNADFYSGSTSHHQSLIQEHCNGPRVSFRQLSEYIHFSQLTKENILFWRKPVYEYLWKDTLDGKFYSNPKHVVLGVADPYPTGPWLSLDEKPDTTDIKNAFKLINLERHLYVFEKAYKFPRGNGTFKEVRRQLDPRFIETRFSLSEILILRTAIGEQYLLCMGHHPHTVVQELVRKPRSISEALKMKVIK